MFEIIKIKDKHVGDSTKISTFMNIHNVHVNRMPLDGEIKDIAHYKGAHIPAFKKESEKNERVVLLIDTKIGIIKMGIPSPPYRVRGRLCLSPIHGRGNF